MGNNKFRFHRSLSLSTCKIVDIDYGDGNIVNATSGIKKSSAKQLLKRVATLHGNPLYANPLRPKQPKQGLCTFTIQSNLKSFVAIVPKGDRSKYALKPQLPSIGSGSVDKVKLVAGSVGREQFRAEIDGLTSSAIGKLWVHHLEDAIRAHKASIMGIVKLPPTATTIPATKRSLSPQFDPDAASKSCLICDKPFSYVFRMRHHCRKCGILCCGACSPYRELIASIDSEKKVRICKNCHFISTEVTM